MRRLLPTVVLLLLCPSAARADWSPAQPHEHLPFAAPNVAPGHGRSVWATWVEPTGCAGAPCAGRLLIPGGTVERRRLDRPARAIAIDADGNALIVRSVRRGRGACAHGRLPSRVEVLRWPAGRAVGRPRRLGTPCDARYPAVAVAPGGRALVAWAQNDRIRLAAGTARGGVRSAGTLSPRRGRTVAPVIGEGRGGDVVVAYGQDSAVFATAGSFSGRFGASRRVGAGTGLPVVAVAPDGSALVAWTSAFAGGEVGTSAPNTLLAALRPRRGSPFGGAAALASGTLRDVVVAAGNAGAIVGWSAEDVPGGGSSGVAFAPAGGAFEPVHSFDAPGHVAVGGDGTAHAALAGASGVGTIRRTGPATWTSPQPYPGGALAHAGDGTLVAVAPDSSSTYAP